MKIYFEQFGTVKSIDFKKGYAFIHYLSFDAVNSCCKPGFEHTIDGKRVDVKVKQATSSLNKQQQQQQTLSNDLQSGSVSQSAIPTDAQSSSQLPISNYQPTYEGGAYVPDGGMYGMGGPGLSRDAPGLNVGRKVFVGGLSQDVRESDLREMMQHHGTIEDVVVMMDRHTKRSRGYGFVTFSTQEEAQAASSNNRQLLGDKYCEVKLYVPGAKGQGFVAPRGYQYPHQGYHQYQQSHNDWNRHRYSNGRHQQTQYYDPYYQSNFQQQQQGYGPPQQGQPRPPPQQQWSTGSQYTPPPQQQQQTQSSQQQKPETSSAQQQQQQPHHHSSQQQYNSSAYRDSRDNSSRDYSRGSGGSHHRRY